MKVDSPCFDCKILLKLSAFCNRVMNVEDVVRMLCFGRAELFFLPIPAPGWENSVLCCSCGMIGVDGVASGAALFDTSGEGLPSSGVSLLDTLWPSSLSFPLLAVFSFFASFSFPPPSNCERPGELVDLLRGNLTVTVDRRVGYNTGAALTVC